MPPFSTANAQAPSSGGRKSYRDALCGRQIATFNSAVCGYYTRHCRVPVRCPPADAEEQKRLGEDAPCVDLSQNCLSWARRGECDSNPDFMKQECAQSCGSCADRQPFLGSPVTTCLDDEHEASCASMANLGACTTQRTYMQEACRKTCSFCNSSSALPGPKLMRVPDDADLCSL